MRADNCLSKTHPRLSLIRKLQVSSKGILTPLPFAMLVYATTRMLLPEAQISAEVLLQALSCCLTEDYLTRLVKYAYETATLPEDRFILQPSDLQFALQGTRSSLVR